MRRVVLIDTDTASDDAVAIIMALRSPSVEVAAITVVAGNVPVEQATRNALLTAELCASDVPVFTGAAKPLQRELEPATWFHGMDGLGDLGYAPTRRTAERTHAAEAIVACVHANPGLELITLGPLTNIALALRLDASIAKKIGRCVVMGGAPSCEGNVTPAAEFNIWADPEAARATLLSGLQIELVGWQLSRWNAVVSQPEMDAIQALGTPLAEFAVRCNSRACDAYLEQTGECGMSLPDPVAMAVLLQPELILEASEHFVEIETSSLLTRGMTVVDRLDRSADHRNAEIWHEARTRMQPARVIWKIDVPGWKKLLLSSLS